MKKLLLFSTLFLLFISGFSQYRYFYGVLSGANEVPANGSTGTGIVIVKYTTATNAVELFGNYNGLSANITASHIHQAAIGVNGGVVVGLTNTGGVSGTLTVGGTITDPQETELLAGNMYVNVHSSSFPGGEIRAQLTPVADGDGLWLNARLQGAQEVPANVSAATGLANLLLERSTNKVYLTGSYANLSTNISNQHIHMGRPGFNGGVIVGLVNSGGTSGTLHGTGTFTDAQEDSLVNARTYVNVHSTTFPGGEIRGQLTTFSQQQFFGGRLSGANEVPANGSVATGTVIVRYNTLTNELELNGNYEKLSANITGSHIHNAPAGSNGGVIVALTNSGSSFGVLNATATLTDPQESELLAGNMYVNVHSSSFPGGEIRAQLMPATSGEAQYAQVLLSGLQEVPSNLSTATGAAVVLVDKISGQTYVTGGFTGLGGNITGSHIHQAATGVNGGVIMALTNDGTTQGVFSGSQVLTPTQVEAFINGLTYINIHSTLFPGGEIRAQLGDLVLPVKLGYFNGFRQKNNVVLQWEATTQENVKQYEVEQQNTETGNWMLRMVVPARDGSPATYKAEDLPARYSQSFVQYRLKMVDKDGTKAYSPVLKINMANTAEDGIILMGNPVTHSLQFRLNANNMPQRAEAMIIDQHGRRVALTAINGAGNQQINTSSLPGGLYILQVRVNEEILVMKFLKQ